MEKGITHPKYLEELENLKSRMIKAQSFAKKIPLFANKIIEYKFCEDDENLCFGYQFKSIPLAWGINRYDYRKDGRSLINSSDIDKNKHLFSIYINIFDLFGDGMYEEFDLYERVSRHAYYTGKLNSTFYVEDEHIEEFLEALNEWYVDALDKVKEKQDADKIKKLENELAKLKQKGESK